MNRNKKFASGVNVGSSSILVTFVLLCLVTFAALAFISANSDYNLSRQVGERTKRYYDACKMADVYLYNLESKVVNELECSNDASEFYKNTESLFDKNDIISVHESDNRLYFNYDIAISEKQVLEIELSTDYSELKSKGALTVDKWQAVPVEPSELKLEDNNSLLLF